MKIYMKEKNFALIGYPLGHSMSAVIHNELFKISGIDASYVLKEVKPENLKDTFDNELKSLDGFNVTIPHKIDIISCLDDVSYRAGLFSSVNTVDISDGQAKGHNTDCSGFLRSLEMKNIPLSGRVLLCGAGGVARMIAFESILAGCDLTIAVREADIPAANTIRQEIRDKLSKDCQITLLADAQQGYDLVINATPVGMYPDIDACPINKEVIQSAGAVFDVIYNPIDTKFLQYAKQAGIKYSGGLAMLVWQAAVAEEIWNGVKFSNDDIAKVLEITKKELEK